MEALSAAGTDLGPSGLEVGAVEFMPVGPSPGALKHQYSYLNGHYVGVPSFSFKTTIKRHFKPIGKPVHIEQL